MNEQARETPGAAPAPAPSSPSPPAAALGLTAREAAARLLAMGANEPISSKRRSLALRFLSRFTNPLVLVLVVACVVSAALGDIVNSGVVLVIVAVSAIAELVQTRRSERAADALRLRVSDTATVRRDGVWKEIPRREIVPGDVVRLGAGDLVPADATLIEGKDLHVNEAALTGESLPVEKEPNGSNERDRHLSMGSSVVSGNAVALVTATGPRTAFGAIAKEIQRTPPVSEFERGLHRFGFLILKTVIALVLFVIVVMAVLKRDPLESLLFAVALAVGLTPEFLPMITTIALTRGAVRMAEANVIVKNLAAIQNFGSIDVLCCDKTGTLTSGEMTLERHVDPFGQVSERAILLSYLNSYFESGISNPIDTAVLEKAKLNPLDSAVLRHDHPDISGFEKIDEIPFDFERRRVSIVARRANEVLLVAKGAPEHVLSVSTTYEERGEVLPLDDAIRARCEATFVALGREGYRVLAVGYRSATKLTGYTREDERELTLAGFVAFVDPPRTDARAVVAALREEQIQVKVLTGDGELVAAHVCGAVGISTEHLLTGGEVDKMTDTALQQRAERTHLFARMNPAQKSRVLRALRARGHVVGYIGDGINDAPSLRAADVGISVSSALDVAKEAAEIILLEPGLDVLRVGVLEGRKAFGNVMKYLLMGTSSNFGNMFSMAGASLFLPFLPMLPMQILLNNFLYDLAQITIPSDRVDSSFVKRPHRWDVGLIKRFMLAIGPLSSIYDFVTFFVLLRVLRASESMFHTGWFVESLATQTLVIFVIRTAARPWRSRPSRALTWTTLGVVAAAVALPYCPLAKLLGFVPLPPVFFGFLAVMTLTYLALVETLKRLLFKKAFG